MTNAIYEQGTTTAAGETMAWLAVADVLRVSARRTARASKTYECGNNDCDLIIREGTHYSAVSTRHGGRWRSWRFCDVCAPPKRKPPKPKPKNFISWDGKWTIYPYAYDTLDAFHGNDYMRQRWVRLYLSDDGSTGVVSGPIVRPLKIRKR